MNKLMYFLMRFFAAMVNRFTEKDEQGWNGWDSRIRRPSDLLRKRLIDNARDGQWIDVANFAFMLWIREVFPARIWNRDLQEDEDETEVCVRPLEPPELELPDIGKIPDGHA